MAQTKAQARRRAIGISRVSREGDRKEERLYSYDTQASAITESCEREGMDLLYVGKERTVSGGANLANRPEFSRAVEAVERGEADVIVAAYFDRFFRNLSVQAQVIERVEKAGGELLTLDHGRLTNGTAAERLQSNIIGSMSQFFREQIAEKSKVGQAAAVARGAVPWSRVPLGYSKRDDATLEPNPAEIPLVEKCFAMRLGGASVMTIRAMLREHGVERSPRGVEQLLQNRAYLGEIRFGNLVNLHAHEPILDRDLFERVQRKKLPRGRQPKSDRLLARLRVLRCGSCGSPLGTMRLPRQDDYPIYRCGSHNDCDGHVTISAEITEAWVWDQVKAKLAEKHGAAGVAERTRQAFAERDRAQEKLDHAMRTLGDTGLSDEPTAIDTLAALRIERDASQDAVDRLAPEGTPRIVDVNDDLPQAVRRDLIQTVVRSIHVAPTGPDRLKGAARLRIEFFGD